MALYERTLHILCHLLGLTGSCYIDHEDIVYFTESFSITTISTYKTRTWDTCKKYRHCGQTSWPRDNSASPSGRQLYNRGCRGRHFVRLNLRLAVMIFRNASRRRLCKTDLLYHRGFRCEGTPLQGSSQPRPTKSVEWGRLYRPLCILKGHRKPEQPQQRRYHRRLSLIGDDDAGVAA